MRHEQERKKGRFLEEGVEHPALLKREVTNILYNKTGIYKQSSRKELKSQKVLLHLSKTFNRPSSHSSTP